jgi:hypothetical protein
MYKQNIYINTCSKGYNNLCPTSKLSNNNEINFKKIIQILWRSFYYSRQEIIIFVIGKIIPLHFDLNSPLSNLTNMPFWIWTSWFGVVCFDWCFFNHSFTYSQYIKNKLIILGCDYFGKFFFVSLKIRQIILNFKKCDNNLLVVGM